MFHKSIRVILARRCRGVDVIIVWRRRMSSNVMLRYRLESALMCWMRVGEGWEPRH